MYHKNMVWCDWMPLNNVSNRWYSWNLHIALANADFASTSENKNSMWHIVLELYIQTRTHTPIRRDTQCAAHLHIDTCLVVYFHCAIFEISIFCYTLKKSFHCSYARIRVFVLNKGHSIVSCSPNHTQCYGLNQKVPWCIRNWWITVFY